MHKHRKFPSGLSGTTYHFTLRRAGKTITPLVSRERFRDRKDADCRADRYFLAALWQQFGNEPFERGNLDATRLSFLFGREVIAAKDSFDPQSYEALLKINLKIAQNSFPEVFQ